MKEWMKDKSDEYGRVRLGLHEELGSYTPTIDEGQIDRLASEFKVPAELIKTALKGWWRGRVGDELNAFYAEVAKLPYDTEAAENFAKRFL